MYKIYKIEDCNGLIYIGKTIQNVNDRFNNHKADKKRDRGCSSQQLDLDNSIITILEDNITEEDSFEKERYYINFIDCVNNRKLIRDTKVSKKKYRSKQENKDKEKKTQQLYLINNKEKLKIKRLIKYNYKISWGGNPLVQNNLLRINTNLFII